jgi:hypothetical protein
MCLALEYVYRFPCVKTALNLTTFQAGLEGTMEFKAVRLVSADPETFTPRWKRT